MMNTLSLSLSLSLSPNCAVKGLYSLTDQKYDVHCRLVTPLNISTSFQSYCYIHCTVILILHMYEYILDLKASELEGGGGVKGVAPPPPLHFAK